LQAWGAEKFASNGQHGGLGRLAAPPVQLHSLWAKGALCWTPEYGLELHPSALVLLEKVEAIRHRLWRGQASLLLPIIDTIRIVVCEYLTQRYRKDWPLCWHTPESPEETSALRENALACQWGYLEWLLGNCEHFARERDRLLPLARRMKHMRNELAHYRRVTLSDFEGIRGEVNRIQRFGIFIPGFV
jgi:hypothetical protein